MNKGLEVIEAARLFDLAEDRIGVLVHPQSVIHGMVYYHDGSVLAQLGSPDMRIPIAHTLAWPERMATTVAAARSGAAGPAGFRRARPGPLPGAAAWRARPCGPAAARQPFCLRPTRSR